MTIADLACLVRLMRSAQVDYFRTRSTDTLRLSKELEKRTDRAVSDILDPPTPLWKEQP
jgi:hypothetical protein